MNRISIAAAAAAVTLLAVSGCTGAEPETAPTEGGPVETIDIVAGVAASMSSLNLLMAP